MPEIDHPIRAMILAAGRGERLRPLTDHTPKPLLPVHGKPLIVHHIEHLATAGVTDIIINLNHLAEQIPAALGDGSRWHVRLHYSWENHLSENLETAGGIRHALSQLSDTFILVNGDIFTNYPFEGLLNSTLDQETDFRLVMVANPPHHSKGDFSLQQQKLQPCSSEHPESNNCLTYAGIGLYKKSMFAGFPEGRRALGTLLHEKIIAHRGQGMLFSGTWIDVGTQERLQQAENASL
jgi:N-acetyl-alpha-D-muramate 1-phosphate uridylyltransferase